MSRVVDKTIEYYYGSTRMLGQFAVDEEKTGPRPAVLVVPEAFGLGEHAIGRALRLAELGYAALAIDLWGERTQMKELPNIMETVGRFVSDRSMWMGHVEAARQTLIAQPTVDRQRLAAIGFCFGGTTVLEYARVGANIRAAISFHGGLDPLGTEWDASRTVAKLLICTGAEDPTIPTTSVVALQDHLRRGGVNWEVATYSEAKHSFTNPDADKAGMPQALAYNRLADKRSWERLTAMLNEVFI